MNPEMASSSRKRKRAPAEADSFNAKRSKSGPHVDRLSQLPLDLIDEIFRRIPLRQVAQTMLLSKDWRAKWCRISDIIFDKASVVKKATSGNFLNGLILRHVGPIHTIDIGPCLVTGVVPLSRWLEVIRSKNTQKISFMFADGVVNVLPSTIITFSSLQTLELSSCSILLPASTKLRLTNLMHLILHKVKVENGDVNMFCSYMPSLVTGSISQCTPMQVILFDSHLLVRVAVAGDCSLVNFCNAKKSLKDLTLRLDSWGGTSKELQWIRLRMDVSLAGLEVLETVTLYQPAVQVAQLEQEAPEMIFFRCQYLRKATLHLICNDPGQLEAAFCLIQRSPVLEEMHIRALRSTRFAPRRMGKLPEHKTKSLKIFSITKFTGSEPEMFLVQYVMTRASSLIDLSIGWDVHASIFRRRRISMKIAEYPTAAENVKISFLSKQ